MNSIGLLTLVMWLWSPVPNLEVLALWSLLVCVEEPLGLEP